MGKWTLFSNHGHVLVCLMRTEEVRLRDVAAQVGITERAVQKIVRELQDEDFIAVTKHGRCNRYRVNTRRSLRHELEVQCTVGKLLQAVAGKPARSAKGKVPPAVRPVQRETPSARGHPAATAPVAASAGGVEAPPVHTTGVDTPTDMTDPEPLVLGNGQGETPGPDQQGRLF